jgi:hypothetical protein
VVYGVKADGCPAGVYSAPVPLAVLYMAVGTDELPALS